MGIRTIVVGIDDSPGSRRALAWTAELAAGLRARVVAVHAFEPLAHVGELAPGVDLRALRERTTAQVQGELTQPLRERGVEHAARVLEGEPAEVLLDAARKEQAELIVVGARRMGMLKSLALGSTSQKVMHHAGSPVVIVPLDDPRQR
jgi:nucleotide-binding universal stress UspA family protein